MQEVYTAEMAHRAAQQAITIAEKNTKDIHELRIVISELTRIVTELVVMVAEVVDEQS